MTTFVGQNLGAGKADRIEQGKKKCILLAMLITVFLGAVVSLFAAQLVSLFNDEPKVIEIGTASRNAEDDLRLIQERYAWFLTEMYKDAPSEKKKGQKKEALALRIYKQCIDAFVSGISLGADTEVDAPQINVQYEIVSIDGEHAELAEKMYFDRLADFVYVELMKGIQHDFIPKCCQNCGRWFLQQPGMTYNYCGELVPGEAKLTCRDIGAAVSFKAKVQNNEIWQIHQRAYKKYYARIKKGNMSKAEFERWARNAEELRDEALQQYEFLHTEDERKEFIESFRADMNRE